jgi:hypothetical protein
MPFPETLNLHQYAVEIRKNNLGVWDTLRDVVDGIITCVLDPIRSDAALVVQNADTGSCIDTVHKARVPLTFGLYH